MSQDHRIRIAVSGPVGCGKSHVVSTIVNALEAEYGNKIEVVMDSDLPIELEYVAAGHGVRPKQGAVIEINELTPKQVEREAKAHAGQC